MTQPQNTFFSVRPFSSSYRPDIDGLRGVAVLAVLGFHGFPSHVPWGFLGVDVFFVISGYLISGQIFREIRAGTFHLGSLYQRRIRRLFPALCTVLFATGVVGWNALLPHELERLGKHAAAAAVFLSNFVLRNETGYFDPASEFKPLLHLWSLGIEEQFYLFWPLLVMGVAAWNKGTNFLGLCGVCGVLSLAFYGLGVPGGADSVFYLPHARLWELVAGAGLAAWNLDRPSPEESRSLRHGWLSGLSAATVVAGMALVGPHSVASLPALALTVGGTVGLIAAGPIAPVNRFLSLRALVFVGLISYPLYLWHWPLLSFAHILEGGVPPLGLRTGCLVLAGVLAAATYRWIELPLRYGVTGPRKTFALAGALMSLGAVGWVSWTAEGLPHRDWVVRLGLQASDLKRERPSPTPDRWVCGDPEFQEVHCHLEGEGPPKVVLLGDSHAEAFYEALRDLYKEYGIRLDLFGAKVGCTVFQGLMQVTWKCHQPVKVSVDRILDTPEITHVVILTHDPLYYRGDKIPPTDFDSLDIDVHGNYVRWMPSPKEMRRSLEETLQRFHDAGKTVVFLHTIPALEFEARRCLDTRPRFLGWGEVDCSVPRALHDRRSHPSRRMMESIFARFPNVHTVDFADALCDDERCTAKEGGRLLYRDEDHASWFGARYVTWRLRDELVAPFLSAKLPRQNASLQRH